MAVVAFIGLGVMGGPMARHLAEAGHAITVYNRTRATADAWVAANGGAAADTPAEAARNASAVFACVGNDDSVREIFLGESGALAGMRPGTVFVDHTTASAELARELHTVAARREVGFVDAPVSGGQAGAESGQLTVMAGGDAPHFEAIEPLVRAFAREFRRLGPSGAGQLTKMVNQICIAGLVQGLSEALNFARRAGLDAREVIEVISKGAAQSWQMENRYETMLDGEYDHGFAVDWMRKDLDIALREANRNGASLPVTALVDQFYGDVQRLGGGRWDTSSLLKRLQALD